MSKNVILVLNVIIDYLLSIFFLQIDINFKDLSLHSPTRLSFQQVDTNVFTRMRYLSPIHRSALLPRILDSI